MSTGVTAPRGFQAAGVAAGIKDKGPDLALVVAAHQVNDIAASHGMRKWRKKYSSHAPRNTK